MTKLALSPKARTQMILRALLAPVLMIGLLFFVAGRWDYWQAWVYSIINMIVLVLMGTLLTRNSELVEERLNPKEGPYHYVRHPGYVGGFLFTITIGLMLGSWWASIPQVIAALMLIWRTAREDKTLQAELPGYTKYATETRFRLLPGVW